jgi:hypothetical protein
MSETTARIAAAYEAAGPALTLGAVVHEGVADPAAQVRIALSMLNRHGLIAGATGTGKTKTLQLMAEQLSSQGVPVFATDVKGDLSGLAQAGEDGERVAQRSREVGDAGWAPTAFPVELFSPGLPLRASLTSFGPILLAKVLDLNETQSPPSRSSSTGPTRTASRCSTSPTCGRSSRTSPPRRARRSSRGSAGSRARRPGSSCARSPSS